MTTFTHPSGAAFEDISLPPPPKLRTGREAKFLTDLDRYLRSLFLVWGDLETSLRQGWLLKDARFVNVSVEKLFAGSITTPIQSVTADILGLKANTDIQITCNAIYPVDDDTTKLGKSGNSWGEIWGNSTQLHDLVFANKMYITEARQINPDSPVDGLYIMSHKRKPVALLCENGDLILKGKVKEDTQGLLDFEDTRPLKSEHTIELRNIAEYDNRIFKE